MKLTTAGESHGKALIGIIENMPSGVTLDIGEIDKYLSYRQSGYGRGARQKIESDRIQLLSGVRNLKTLGSPLSFMIENKDYLNWQSVLGAEGCDESLKRVTKVRPGHADLAGMLKYGTDDARNILERASARETAVRVAAGTVARQFLRGLGVDVQGYVKEICGVADGNKYAFDDLAESKQSRLFALDKTAEQRMVEKIDELKAQGDTAGGIVEVRVRGLKSGFGSCMQYDKKLDAQLASHIMSVQAAKGVEFGLGFSYAHLSGANSHDEIYHNGSFKRRTNNAGGIEGGMSNGEDIVISVVKKSIPTLMKGLSTVDFVTKQAVTADTERSDVTAVPAFLIVIESVVCMCLAEAVILRLGGDTLEEIKARWKLLP